MTGSAHSQENNAHATPQAARLSSLVDEAQGLMDELVSISVGHTDAIKGGDVAKIVEIVSTREPIVASLVRVGEEIGAFIADPDAIAKVGDAECEQAFKRIGAIEHTMKRLRERDAQDQILMESARDQLAGQLAGMGTGKTALRAYKPNQGTPNPILQDRQG
tara:strand:+ start:30845 stop:31330 length:486 start_codon:yes stop_codon:yes gene_type:complete